MILKIIIVLFFTFNTKKNRRPLFFFVNLFSLPYSPTMLAYLNLLTVITLFIIVNHPEHGEKKHLCDLCGKGFIFPSSVNRHKVLNHQKKTCHICGKECFNKSSLKDHMSSAHKFEEMTLMCQFCTFSTSSKGNLKSHIAAKHKLDNHKKCPYCEYHTHALHRIQIHV